MALVAAPLVGFVDPGAVNCGSMGASGGVELHLGLGGGMSLNLVRR